MVQTLEKDVILTTNLMGEDNYTFLEDKSIKSTSCCFSLPSHIYIFTPIYRFCSTKVKTLIPLDLVRACVPLICMLMQPLTCCELVLEIT